MELQIKNRSDNTKSLHVFAESEEEEGGTKQKLVVLRHGRRLQPSDPRFFDIFRKCGWDIPSSACPSEYLRKASQLQHISFGIIAISPFCRCLQAAENIIPHLQIEKACRIFVHKGLSDVHTTENIFPRSSTPSIAQKFALWRWHSKRDDVLPEFAQIGKFQVQKNVLGKWPNVPETVKEAHIRYEAALSEILELAHGSNVLLITHGECVKQLFLWLRPGSVVDEVEDLGHIEAQRRIFQGGDAGCSGVEARTSFNTWMLMQPPEDIYGQKALCGVNIIPERQSELGSKYESGRRRERDLDDKMKLALSSNPWWAMTE